MEGPSQAAVTPVGAEGRGDPRTRCHGRRAEFPHLRSNFLVFRGSGPAPPLYLVHISHILAVGKSAHWCPVSVCCHYLFLWPRSGRPGLASSLKVRHSSDTLFEGRREKSGTRGGNGSLLHKGIGASPWVSGLSGLLMKGLGCLY